MHAHPLPLSEEKRRHQRVRVNLLGRFMLPGGQEYPCQVVNMSPGGGALISSVLPDIGQRIVAYIDEIGRLDGKVVRTFDGGFAFAINATSRKRDKLADQLTWLANRAELGIPEDRRHDRVHPRNPYSQIKLPDGRTYPCRVIDMSISGAAVELEVRPALNSDVLLGRMRARVVRHFPEGVAVRFLDVQDAKSLVDRLADSGGKDDVALSA